MFSSGLVSVPAVLILSDSLNSILFIAASKFLLCLATLLIQHAEHAFVIMRHVGLIGIYTLAWIRRLRQRVAAEV